MSTVDKVPFGNVDNAKFFRWAAIIALILLAVLVLPRLFTSTKLGAKKVVTAGKTAAANTNSAIKGGEYEAFLRSAPEIQTLVSYPGTQPAYEVTVEGSGMSERALYTVSNPRDGNPYTVKGSIKVTSTGLVLEDDLNYNGSPISLEEIRSGLPSY